MISTPSKRRIETVTGLLFASVFSTRFMPHSGQAPGLSKESLSQAFPHGGQMYAFEPSAARDSSDVATGPNAVRQLAARTAPAPPLRKFLRVSSVVLFNTSLIALAPYLSRD